jgi:cytoskeletal protein RodZ
METLGQFLKREREFRGVSIDRLSGMTRINASVLKKIEDNNFGGATQAIYIRSFLKAYAGQLGLDAAEVLSRYEGQIGIEPIQTPVSASIAPAAGRARAGYGMLWIALGAAAVAVLFMLLRYVRH